MGCCCITPEDSGINQHLFEDRLLQKNIKHLLLLGTGSSGKSTLFKQIKCIQGEIFIEQDYVNCLQAIRTNCVQAIFTLLQKSDQLYNRDPQVYKNCFVDYNDQEIINLFNQLYQWWIGVGQTLFDAPFIGEAGANFIMNSSKIINSNDPNPTTTTLQPTLIGSPSEEKDVELEQQKEIRDHDSLSPKKIHRHINHIGPQSNNSVAEVMNKHDFSTIFPFQPDEHKYDWETIEQMGSVIKKLWNLKGIQCTFQERNGYSLPDNMDFYLNKIEDIMKCDYVCTDEDCFKVSYRTTGAHDFEYIDANMKQHKFHIYDLGGQRSERRKWIRHFADVDGLIYVAALNHYASLLFEDEGKNAMHESLELFSEIANNKYFRLTDLILFLNKEDLYRERIRDGKSLSLCFSSKAGWPGEEWDLSQVADIESDMSEEKYFDAIASAGIKFITRQYLKQLFDPTRYVLIHVTTAIQTESTKLVFWDLQTFVLRSNLKSGGVV